MGERIKIGTGEWNATLNDIEWDLNDYDEQMPEQISVSFTEEEYYKNNCDCRQCLINFLLERVEEEIGGLITNFTLEY